MKSLAAVRTHYHAGKGGQGQGALKTGKRGTNVVVKVIVCSMVIEIDKAQEVDLSV